jgi:hypothetical protein
MKNVILVFVATTTAACALQEATTSANLQSGPAALDAKPIDDEAVKSKTICADGLRCTNDHQCQIVCGPTRGCV